MSKNYLEILANFPPKCRCYHSLQLSHFVIGWNEIHQTYSVSKILWCTGTTWQIVWNYFISQKCCSISHLIESFPPDCGKRLYTQGRHLCPWNDLLWTLLSFHHGDGEAGHSACCKATPIPGNVFTGPPI